MHDDSPVAGTGPNSDPNSGPDDGLDAVRRAALADAGWALDLLAPAASAVPHSRRSEELRTEIRAELDRRLPALTDAQGRAFLIALLLEAENRDRLLWHFVREVRQVAARTGGWTRDEAAVLLRGAARVDRGARLSEVLAVALTAAESVGPAGLAELYPSLRLASGRFARLEVPRGYRPSLAKRLWALLETVDEAHVPDGLLPLHETWAAPLRDRAAASPTAELAGLVRHLAGLSSPRPSQKWRGTCVALATAASAEDAVAGCLRGLAGDEPAGAGDLVHHDHGDLARGIAWAAALTGGAAAIPDLAVLALRMGASSLASPEEQKVAGASINALAAIDDPGALDALWRLRARVRNRALRKQLDTALRSAAERQGITPAQLVERTVPSHGLGPDGGLERRLGGHTARVEIQDAATVRLTFTGADGRTSRTAPAAVRDGFPGELKELKALAKEVRATLSAERARIERLMSDERVWPYAEWREHYCDHPVTGALARALVWEFQDEGEDGTGPGDWRARLGAPEDKPARVRLWHPIRAAVDEVRAWRERIDGERLRQPFKQAFREIYLLTPAEEETGTYSNRFAAHVVRYPQLYALFRERGWQANFLSGHDGGHSGEARGEFGGGRWRARFHHESAGGTGHAPEYAATGQVRFERGDGRGRREEPLAEVPPVVFSEAMRDVDLFVGVTSIAADPQWADGGEGRHLAYWREATFGELTASAAVRRAALERILPRTKIADRCSIDGRFLVVRGELRTYKIHLGSAGVLMEPGNVRLRAEPTRRPGQKGLFLPFEDERLALILGTAFLLAADRRISDQSVLRQIRTEA